MISPLLYIVARSDLQAYLVFMQSHAKKDEQTISSSNSFAFLIINPVPGTSESYKAVAKKISRVFHIQTVSHKPS
jgi:hypothetical protein